MRSLNTIRDTPDQEWISECCDDRANPRFPLTGQPDDGSWSARQAMRASTDCVATSAGSAVDDELVIGATPCRAPVPTPCRRIPTPPEPRLNVTPAAGVHEYADAVLRCRLVVAGAGDAVERR